MLNVECYSAPQLFGLPYQHMIIDEDYKNASVFVSFPQKRNGIVFSSGVNYLHSGGNIQSE